MHLLRLEQHAERQCHQQAELVGGVMTPDIEGRVGLGQTAALGLLERVGEFRPALGHHAENRVAGAVDDAVNGALTIARQRLAQRADDRHAATYARLEAYRQTGLAGRAKNLRAMRGEQRLVRRYDVLARGERLQNQAARRFVAAEQFGHDIDIGAFDEGGRIARD